MWWTISKRAKQASMSSDNLQMHQINSTGSVVADSTLANSQNSNSSTSMQKSANIQFVSDSPITDPGQSSKVSEPLQISVHKLSERAKDLLFPASVWTCLWPSLWHLIIFSIPIFVFFFTCESVCSPCDSTSRHDTHTSCHLLVENPKQINVSFSSSGVCNHPPNHRYQLQCDYREARSRKFHPRPFVLPYVWPFITTNLLTKLLIQQSNHDFGAADDDGIIHNNTTSCNLFISLRSCLAERPQSTIEQFSSSMPSPW